MTEGSARQLKIVKGEVQTRWQTERALSCEIHISVSELNFNQIRLNEFKGQNDFTVAGSESLLYIGSIFYLVVVAAVLPGSSKLNL